MKVFVYPVQKTAKNLQDWDRMRTFAIPNRMGKSKARGRAEDEERRKEEQKRKSFFSCKYEKASYLCNPKSGITKRCKRKA
ncbi:hypothetical protein [Arcticibacter eurypsychrophilus]|uniref:hypothetical protein n=1 Tax=Arcticibacter eurypsychrophilus TaxID=1434752 RepID=UPI001479EDED|nr:hypothetical protein [Arcticibacter eurypsychrophilus]